MLVWCRYLYCFPICLRTDLHDIPGTVGHGGNTTTGSFQFLEEKFLELKVLDTYGLNLFKMSEASILNY